MVAKVGRKQLPIDDPTVRHRVVNRRLASVDIGERTEQLTLALTWMLDGYDKAAATMPAGSQARALLDGAFGKTVQLARDVLGA